jgi:hypothetical protein
VHRLSRPLWVCCAALAAVAAAAPARAQVVLVNADWDANTPTYQYGYTYQNAGSSSFTAAVTPGVGVGGSAGYRIAFDFTNASGAFWGGGGGAGQVPIATPLLAVTGLSQFTYSFAASATGFTATAPATSGINISVSFTAPDGTLGPPDGNSDQIAAIDLDIAPYNTVAGGFQTFSGTLAGGTFSGGTSLAQLQTFRAAVNQAQLNINFNGGTDFGADNNNVVVLDNVLLTQVPEPTSLALAGLGGLGAAWRWRRRARGV